MEFALVLFFGTIVLAGIILGARVLAWAITLGVKHLIRQLVRRGMWFPKSMKQLHLEAVQKIELDSSTIDHYIDILEADYKRRKEESAKLREKFNIET